MSFRSVYRSLQEVFPQVDLRILKAVAIEHSTDVDAAVEFILLDVLPSLNSQEESHTHSNAQEESLAVDRSSLCLSSSPRKEEAHSSYSTHPVEKVPGTDYTRAVLHADPLGQGEAICDGSSVGFVVESKEVVLNEAAESGPSETLSLTSENVFRLSETVSLTSENVFVNDTTNDSCSVPPLGGSVVNCPPSAIQDGYSGGSQVWIDGEVEEPIQLDKSQGKQDEGSSSESNLSQCEDFIVNWSSPLLADPQGLFGFDVPSAVGKTTQDFSESSLEENLGSVQHGLVGGKALGTSSNGCEEEPFFSVNAAAELSVLGNENTMDDERPASSVSSRSGQVVSIDLLEEFVTDCRGIKNTLVSAMESVVDMMKEVDLREKEASLAKEAASKAGLDILEKVEDLKEMLKHAKEANNMHAGEVYGEKSILATEARELQARLLSLSDQRYKSLAIIEEIHQTLKVRLVTAEEERAKAEQEKLEKAAVARKALAEQEDIMERVVQESKELQKEADENSKLREFLMERGHLVDTLQGEISVICEDVLALKERVDGRMPLGRSPSSSQVLSSLASSTSSRIGTLSDRPASPVESCENLGTKSQEMLKAQQLECSIVSSEKSVVSGADLKAVADDDDWEYFDGEAELRH